VTRITHADQVLLLLRSHLERSDRARRKRADNQSQSKAERRSAIDRAHDIATSATLAEGEIERVLLSGLLEEEFGPRLVNDPGFQDVIDKVRSAISQDPASQELLRQAVRQLLRKDEP
jgi:hypothetical protein